MNQLLMSLCSSLVYLMCCARGVIIIIIIIIIINSIRTQRSVNVASEVSCLLTPGTCMPSEGYESDHVTVFGACVFTEERERKERGAALNIMTCSLRC